MGAVEGVVAGLDVGLAGPVIADGVVSPPSLICFVYELICCSSAVSCDWRPLIAVSSVAT